MDLMYDDDLDPINMARPLRDVSPVGAYAGMSAKSVHRSQGPLFDEIGITNFSAQLRDSRFPPRSIFYQEWYLEYHAQARMVLDGEFDVETYTGPPPVDPFRNNLIALSQKHNLYFIAVRDSIHCYVPRDLMQTISTVPDFIVETPVSEKGLRTPGVMNTKSPHGINHIIVGDLGDLEILLICFDDGDVMAYYTHQFQNELSRSDVSTRVRSMQPFFHQNVGKSAWGLAIHKKTRLIAVSSNLGQVTIFAHATYPREESTVVRLKGGSYDQLFPNASNLCPLPRLFHDRHRSYKVIIPVNKGPNIPSVTFYNGTGGEALGVASADILGRLALLEPSTKDAIHVFQAGLAGFHGRATDGDDLGSMAWGVLSLELKDFKLVSTIEEAIGFRLDEKTSKHFFVGQKAPYINVSPSFNRLSQMAMRGSRRNPMPSFDSVEDVVPSRNPSPPPHSTGHRLYHREPPRKHNDDYEFSSPESDPDFHALETPVKKTVNIEANTLRLWHFLRLPASVRESIENWQDLIYRSNTLRRLDRHGLHPVVLSVESEVPSGPHKNEQIFLRTYGNDIDLFSLLAIRHIAPHTRLIDPFKLTERERGLLPRFNMLFLISELNLVVAGSQCGQVCLITLTKLNDPEGILPPFLTFRLDQTLPFFSQKQEFMPKYPLLGIAVSPMQQSESSKSSTFPRRWRLIMHYYDHTILSYELGRDGNELLVW